ncbi:MAG: ATP-grasp domain-containing protein [Methylotetracoccus sp.]
MKHETRILLAEYVTGGGLAPEIPDAALLHEGELMIEALVADLSEAGQHQLTVLRDARLPIPRSWRNEPRIDVIPIDGAIPFDLAWGRQLDRCDAVWPIAPETAGVLERLTRQAEASDASLLGCPADAVRLTSSKLATAHRLARAGIAVIGTRSIPCADRPDQWPVVVKPDDGVGCGGAEILPTLDDYRLWHARVADTARYVVQPLLQGRASSLSVLFERGRARLLSINRQHVHVEQRRFHLSHCTVERPCGSREDLQRLAAEIAAALPELSGYAGVDFIDTEQGPVVLEVNPRLTTSYATLRETTGINAAELVLRLKLESRGGMPSTDAECLH